MEQPVMPVEPGKKDSDKDQITHAMAIAIVAIKKVYPDVLITSDLRTWSEPQGDITVRIPGTKAEWKEYEEAMRVYRVEKEAYDAFSYGVSVEVYREAKEKLNEYNRKKCEKAPDRDMQYYISSILEIPDDDDQTDIIIAS